MLSVKELQRTTAAEIRPRLVALLLSACSACGNPVSPSALTGVYDVTVFEFTALADSARRVDLVDEGWVIEFGIANGRYTLVMNGLAGDGTITIDGDAVTLTPGPAAGAGAAPAMSGSISRLDETVTMRLLTGVAFDIDDDGSVDPATLRIVMIRRT